MRGQSGISSGEESRRGGQGIQETLGEPSLFLRLVVLAILLLVMAGGFYLRLSYARTTSPYIDEYTTIWVAQRTVEHGYPVFSTGAIYALGLPFTYLDAILFFLFQSTELIARIPSVIIGVCTIWSVYLVGKRMFSAHEGLLAAAMVALAPQAVLWGGRARNYALIQFIVLWAAFLLYKWAIAEDGDRYGWLFVVAFIAAVFTHNVAMLLYPAFLFCAFLRQGWRWFFRRKVIVANVLMFLGMASSLFLYRRLRPPGWGEVGEGRLEVGVSFNLMGAIQRYKPFFLGWDDLPFAALLTVLCAVAFVYLLLRAARARSFTSILSPSNEVAPLAYLGLLFALIVLEMFFVVNERRWSPRYFFIEAPLFYLIAINVLSRMIGFGERWLRERGWLRTAHWNRWRDRAKLLATALGILVIGVLSWPAATAAIAKGEYGYDRAFRYVLEKRQPGDKVMTFAISPCAVYLGEDGCDYVAIEKDFHSYATQRDGQWIEAWAGVPILFTDDALLEAVETSPRTWFVVDESRLRTRYTQDFIQYVWDRTELVAKEGGVFVFLAESPPPPPLAIQRSLHYNLGDKAALLGCGLSSRDLQPGGVLDLSLRWQALTHILESYSVFVHLVDAEGRMWAQHDGVPLLDLHPTTHWVEGEIVSDPRELPLPAEIPSGRYRVQTGMYLPETMERLPVYGEQRELLGDVAVLDYVRVVDAVPEDLSPQHAVSYGLGEEVTLWGYDLEARDARPGSKVRVTLYWRAEREMDEDYTVFVHLLDSEGGIWGQQDNEPEGGFYRTSFWETGELVRDEYEFIIDTAAPEGEYQIEAGMYILATGQRLPVSDENGQIIDDKILLGSVEVIQ
ncbi:MAG TPA: glycosyltransferase family 39 protein [Anaerolineae bacterium]|nr:glycosyltransferase family 39 protein [Anaerolineae bacterium]